jgi:uncharacterized protein GlcG (DUF336 family)
MFRLLNSRTTIAIPVSLWLASLSFGVWAVPAAAQALMQRNISAAQAMAVVEGALEACGRNGELVTVTIAVVDRAGQPRLMLAGDTSSPHNLELARRKAYTARTFRRPSLEWAGQTAEGSPQSGQRELVDVIPLGGGVPIMIGAEPIGGVGVSGAVGGQPADQACAFAGVAAISDQLQ